jgi:hypothetical protein
MAGDDSDGTSSLVGLALRGGQAYLTGNSAREAFEAIDVGTLLDGGSVEEAIEREQAGKVLGRLLGRRLADELAEGSRIEEFAVKVAGQRVGAQVGQAAIVALLEYGVLAALIDRARGLTTDDALLGLLDEVEAVATPDEEDATPGASETIDNSSPDVEGNGADTTDFDADEDSIDIDSPSDDRR